MDYLEYLYTFLLLLLLAAWGFDLFKQIIRDNTITINQRSKIKNIAINSLKSYEKIVMMKARIKLFAKQENINPSHFLINNIILDAEKEYSSKKKD